MRRRVLLILLTALCACLGAECSDSGGTQTGDAGDGTTHGTMSSGQPPGSIDLEQPFGLPVPEPSAALVFGTGLLIAAGALALRNR